MTTIISKTALLVPMVSFVKKNGGNPTAIAIEKQMICLWVRLNISLVLTFERSLGIGT